tara:strand:+ start:300 stop:572 length:273 start_codon:yes stop_codon:yes gene_type:complete
MQKINKNSKFAFTKNNYIILGVGVLFIIIGLFLMQGGGSDDPTKTNPDLLGDRRTIYAPIIIMIGFIINVFGIIFPLPKPNEEDGASAKK